MPTVVYKTNPYLAIFEHGSGAKRFDFNGVDQYATFPPWAAEGKPRKYAVNFVANAVSTGTEQHILSGTEGGIDLNIYLHATLPVLSIQYRDDVGGQAIEGVLDAADEIVAGVTYTLEIINLGTGPTILLNGKDVDITAFEASDGIQPALTHMGAKHDNTSFFGGSIWATHLSDGSPIHNEYANVADGIRYGELEQPVPLSNAVASVGFAYAAGDQTILNGSVPVLTVVSGVLTGGVNVSNILLDGAVYAGAALTVGQHYQIEFDADGGDIDTFGPLAAGGMMAHLQVEGDI